MKKDGQISLREYATRCGTSHQTVSNAIAAGKIVEGYDLKTKKINPDVADLEWGADFTREKAQARLKQQAAEDISDEDVELNLVPDKSDIPHSTSYKELARLELLYKARLGKLKVETEAGRLVSKEDVYRQLFTFGQNLRQQLQALPDRILDEMLAAGRDGAKEIFEKEIHRILELSSKYENDFNTSR